MDEIATNFRQANPADQVDVVCGSSGNFYTQIQQGAPHDQDKFRNSGHPQLGWGAACV